MFFLLLLQERKTCGRSGIKCPSLLHGPTKFRTI